MALGGARFAPPYIPYQEYADTLFNTSLAYEVPVLKGYVTPLLKTVKRIPVYGEATRLLSFLEYVPVIPSDDVQISPS
ncbi:MAG: hypothetical protein ACLUEQ_08005 [Cloacibacillus evryensis]